MTEPRSCTAPLTPKAVSLNKLQNLVVSWLREHPQPAKEFQNLAAMVDRPEGEFLDDQRVDANLVSPKQFDKSRFRGMKMIDDCVFAVHSAHGAKRRASHTTRSCSEG